MILWKALVRHPKGWDAPLTIAEAQAMGVEDHKFTTSTGGDWAWFWSPEDARAASPQHSTYVVA